jgi:ribosomal protein RSM22 (predicted rRNA methylase)
MILASFSVNEWMEGQTDDALQAWVGRQMEALVPGGWLVIMEPALRASVERMERLRDWVAAEKVARILAPCPHHLPCQILAQKRGWCHEVRRWQPPPSLRLINRQLLRDIELLKWSFLVLQKSCVPDAPAGWTRLVSPVRKEKGKYTCHGCMADGQVRRLEWLTRHLTDDQKQASESLERGDRITTPKGKILADAATLRTDMPDRVSPRYP